MSWRRLFLHHILLIFRRLTLYLSLIAWGVLLSNRHSHTLITDINSAQALIVAYNNKIYRQINQNTIGIVFIGTPHRGADLARMLKLLLDITFSETRSVTDLVPGSQIIKEINDAFGDRAETLQLASFWESRGTAAGVTLSIHFH